MSLNQFPRRSFVGSSTLQTFTGNGTQTAYTLSSTQSQNECFIFVDDVVQVPGVDFTVNGTTLTFTSAPANAAEIIVRGFGVPAPVTTVSDGSVTAAKLATGAIEAKLGYTPVSPTQLNNLIDSAPTALDTLNELAAALGDDANYAATITTALGTKADTSSLGTLATVSPTGTPDSTKFLRGDNSWQVVAVTPTAISDQDNTSTGYFDLPAGTTAQRPISPSSGMTRFNTTTGFPEWYSTSLGSWINFADAPYNVEYIIVAGGGSGGSDRGGGGGAGGYLSGTVSVSSSAQYSIILGAGGAGGVNTYANGNNSTALGLTAIAGGGGGSPYASAYTNKPNGGNGGSGGGGSSSSPYTGGSGTAGQGNSGGNGTSSSSSAGGGGGAGIAGGNASGNVAGNGGYGNYDTWSGPRYLAAGGGGASGGGGTAGSGGTGGGGGGSAGDNNSNAGNASANTGSGGGGATGGGTASSGSGASGIVVIRYSGAQRGTGGTISSSSGYTIHTFTSSGTFTA